MPSKYRRIISVFLACVLMFSCLIESTNSAYAGKKCAIDQEDLKIYSANNILYYCPNHSYSCLGEDGEIPIYGETIEEKIWVGLTSFLSEEQAAGIMGNMMQESKLNPVIHQSGGGSGFGLVQWSGSRRTAVDEFLSEYPDIEEYLDGNDYNYDTNGSDFLEAVGDVVANTIISLEIQYIRDEIDGSKTYKGIYNQNTVRDATIFFLYKYEKPASVLYGDGVATTLTRTKYAQIIYDQLSGSVIEDNRTEQCSDVSILLEYVLMYAWPEYRGKGFTEMMPDYADVVQKRRANGAYVGGGEMPGIDCGGFVTTVIQESGYDPEYGYGGATSSQKKYLDENWVYLGDDLDASDLQPGDVAIFTAHESGKKYGHTWIYVGELDGFESNRASASLRSRAPMAGIDGFVGYHYYRKGSV